jgi:hypothetical protein
MIASLHKKMLRKTNFPHQQSQNNFNRKTTSVDEVTIEKIRVLFRRVTIN